MKRTLVRLLLFALAIGIAFLLGLGLPRLLPSFGPPQVREIDRLAVVRGVRSVLRVTTVEMQLAEVVTYKETGSFLKIVPTEKNAVYRVSGRVLAGIDMGEGRLDIEYQEERGLLRIRLPRARILALDPVVEILDEKSGWMDPVTNEDRNLWYRWARADLRRSALDAGITQEAETRAREMLTALAEGFGVKAEVVFAGEIEEPEATEEKPQLP